MCKAKTRVLIICCIITFTLFLGCAVPNSNLETVSMDYVYHPQVRPAIATLDSAKKDITIVLIDRKRSGKRPFWIESFNKSVSSEIDKLKQRHSANPQTLEFRVFVSDDGLNLPFIGPQLYTNLLDYPIVVTVRLEHLDNGYTRKNYVIKFGNQFSFIFFEGDLADAQRLADALFSIQQHLKKQIEDQLALFQSQATQYRALSVKPQMSEQQRKLVVQANALNQGKDYSGAIDLYRKAVEMDPVSYPGAYFNLALLSAQLRRFNLAITYMKQYLLLETEAKDARAAQDKIYEWEIMTKK